MRICMLGSLHIIKEYRRWLGPLTPPRRRAAAAAAAAPPPPPPSPPRCQIMPNLLTNAGKRSQMPANAAKICRQMPTTVDKYWQKLPNTAKFSGKCRQIPANANKCRQICFQ